MSDQTTTTAASLRSGNQTCLDCKVLPPFSILLCGRHRATDALVDEVLAALAEHAGEQHMGMDCECDLCVRRRALLATF